MKENAVSMIDNIIKCIQKVPKTEYETINYSAEIFNKIKNPKTFLNAPIPTETASLFNLRPNHTNIKITCCLSILTLILKKRVSL